MAKKNMDFDRAATLLNVADLSNNWPTLRAIHDAALEELTAMCQPEPAPAAKPEPRVIPAAPEAPTARRV